MSILRDAMKVISVAEGCHPSLARSALWRVAKKRLLRAAVILETEWQDGDTMGAREALEEEQCQDPGNRASTTDLNATLTELLGKPPLVISASSKGDPPQKIVQLKRSTRLPRT